MSDRIESSELIDLRWDNLEHQELAHRFMVQRGLENDYVRFKRLVAKYGAPAALLKIWQTFTYDAEFSVWFALAARAERELQAAAMSN